MAPPEKDLSPYAGAIEEGSKAAGKFADLAAAVGKQVADIYGIIIGDYVSEQRKRNLDAMTRRTHEILSGRDLPKAAPVAEDIAIPILQAAQKETREEMQEIWATLLANAMDPKRRDDVRQEFIQTLMALNPTDALVLNELAKARPNGVLPGALVRGEIREDAVIVALRHLTQWACVKDHNGYYIALPYGSELVRACSN